MEELQDRKTDTVEASTRANTFAPKKYSAGEHAGMALKIVLALSLFFGLLWFLNAVAAK